MVDVGVDIFPLIRRTAASRDVDAVDELRRLLAEDRLPVADVRLEVAVDLDVGSVVEGVEASVVSVALAFVAVDGRTYRQLECYNKIQTVASFVMVPGATN